VEWNSTAKLDRKYKKNAVLRAIYSENNGAAEQDNRTTVESLRSMLHASGLPKELWAEVRNIAGWKL
jgi:hypothetical protein